MPLHAMRRAAASGGGSLELVIGDTSSESNNSNSFNFTNVALNGTAAAGDIIVACVAGSDDDVADADVTTTMSGWTVIHEEIEQNTLGDDTVAIAVAYKTASGGETTVNVSGSFSFSGTMDNTQCKVFLVKNAAVLDTATATSGGSASINTNASGVTIYTTSGSASTSGDVGSETAYTLCPSSTGATNFQPRARVDSAPVGGTPDSIDPSGVGAFVSFEPA